MSCICDKIIRVAQFAIDGGFLEIQDPPPFVLCRVFAAGIHIELKATNMKKSASKTTTTTRKNPGGQAVKAAQTPAARRSKTVSAEKPGGVSSVHTASSAANSHAARWTFLTNHSHVLILLSRDPSMVLRQVAMQVGITERAVQRIIADLEEAGILEREKVGRQNQYRIMTDKSLRHSVESHRTIEDLLSLMAVDHA